MFWNILVLRDATHDATLLLFWLWRHCMVYWNVNVPNLRAQQKMMQSQISHEIFTVNSIVTPYSQGTQEIPFKLHSFETMQRLMEQWTNSNIRHTVTDGQNLCANMSKCTLNPIKKNPY